MRNLKYVFVLIACWPVVFIKGQSGIACTCDAILDSLMEPNLSGDLYQQVDIGIGSQYFTEEWLKGEVHLANKTTVGEKYLKFNQYLDRLLWLIPSGNQQVLLDKEQIEGFCLNSKPGYKQCFQKIPIKVDMMPDSQLVFGEILHQNKISLFAYRKVILTGYEAVTAGSYCKNIYTVNTTYFLKLENGRTIGFKKHRKRNIINLFPDKKELIVTRFKELKQRHFRTETDLLNIAKVLNEVI